jgi:hypothetical protein
MKGGNARLGLLALMAMYAQPFNHYGNPPDADDKIINPPQSQETKEFYLQKAKEKRLRKKGLTNDPR